jgi:hypothetical protein
MSLVYLDVTAQMRDVLPLHQPAPSNPIRHEMSVQYGASKTSDNYILLTTIVFTETHDSFQYLTCLISES